MSEMILPGVYINVHPEGLIAPGQITIGNLGVVGTAAKGPVDTPILLGSFNEAKSEFFSYDPWLDASGKPNPQALTLVRALELAFAFGANTVYGVRVSTKDANGNTKATAATLTLQAQGGGSVVLTANQQGTWGNHLSIDIQALKGTEPFIDQEVVPITGPAQFKLKRPIDKTSARNRVTVQNQGIVTSFTIVYDKPPKAGAGEVGITSATGALHFAPPDQPKGQAILMVSYTAKVDAQQVTIHLNTSSETYIVADAADLVGQVINKSSWVTGPANTTLVKPLVPIPAAAPAPFKNGSDGQGGSSPADVADYQSGLDALLSADAQIIVAAGQDDHIGPALERHCANASTDSIKSERIALVGSRLIDAAHPDNPQQGAVDTFFDKLIGHSLHSDRLIFVAPGIRSFDAAASEEVTLPGAYAAAAVAGLISSFDPQVSPTNKELPADGLEFLFDAAHLTQMVQNRILAVESRSGFRIVKGITTDDGAFRQITTRRIVDFAKKGVRAAAEPYIGLLNNERVRGALRGTINSFLTDMVNAEQLESYELDVSATRDEEIQGIARVTMSLQPVFSIDFIVVDMFLG
jgi:hypothetical protein